MGKSVLAFAGSNNAKSINHQFVAYAASLVEGAEVKVLDIRDWDVPMYSIDMDPDGTPEQIKMLIAQIEAHDGFIIASPEHNGATPAFFKNIIDWLSRRAKKVFAEKPVLLLSTSPGAGGAAKHLNYLVNSLPYQGATVCGHYSLPSFYDNFQAGAVVVDRHNELLEKVQALQEALGK